jgi:hypothetical protein
MKRTILISFIFSLLLFNNCKKDKEYISISDNFNYPLKIGNTWEYQIKSGDFTYNIKWEVVKKDTIKGKEVYLIQRYLYEENIFKPTFKDYFYNDSDGFYLKATTDTVFVGIPDFKSAVLLNSSDKTTKDQTERLIVFNTPVKILHYPYSIGAQWFSRNHYKKYIKKETIDSKIGRIECMVVEDVIEDNRLPGRGMKQYFSQKGLVKEISYLYLVNEKGELLNIDSTSLGYELIRTNF